MASGADRCCFQERAAMLLGPREDLPGTERGAEQGPHFWRPCWESLPLSTNQLRDQGEEPALLAPEWTWDAGVLVPCARPHPPSFIHLLITHPLGACRMPRPCWVLGGMRHGPLRSPAYPPWHPLKQDGRPVLEDLGSHHPKLGPCGC